MSGSLDLALGAIIIFLLLIIYIIGGSYIESKHCVVGHETSIALICGLLVSLTVFLATDQQVLQSIFEFNGPIFFFVCLPPIIFAAGFNMRRRRFFDNLGYIVLFGLFGTVITFIIFSLLTWGFMESGIMYYYKKGEE